MANYAEPLFTWKKFLSWKTVMAFAIIIGGFSFGYFAQNFLDGGKTQTEQVVTNSGHQPSDLNEDPYIIDFSHQGLLEFPQYLLERPEITDLILSYNGISSLPEEISGLERLRVLDLRYNKLKGLVSDLSSLRLVDINVSHNQLTSIPEEIGRVTTLRYFDVSGNRITSLPGSIVRLQDLKWLNLAGNKLRPTDIERLRQQMPSTIINF